MAARNSVVVAHVSPRSPRMRYRGSRRALLANGV